jgi:hypothetical protein
MNHAARETVDWSQFRLIDRRRRVQRDAQLSQPQADSKAPQPKPPLPVPPRRPHSAQSTAAKCCRVYRVDMFSSSDLRLASTRAAALRHDADDRDSYQDVVAALHRAMRPRSASFSRHPTGPVDASAPRTPVPPVARRASNGGPLTSRGSSRSLVWGIGGDTWIQSHTSAQCSRTGDPRAVNVATPRTTGDVPVHARPATATMQSSVADCGHPTKPFLEDNCRSPAATVVLAAVGVPVPRAPSRAACNVAPESPRARSPR